uniref:Bm7591, isoform a n=1 Tax=Brugia malayi TaxID=6279 RepID=A0A1I9G573_BRUMA|nr:Bm7591, isoform a [Brugia malayi]
MNLTVLSKELCKLSTLREICMFITHCEKLSAELESERRSHADELRQINQDINHLEDTFKSLKNGNDKCQSCEQLIHRNAPICPRCKAKSRSKYSKRLNIYDKCM